MKRRNIRINEFEGPEAEQILSRYGLTRDLDKSQMQMQIARPKLVIEAKAAPFPTVFAAVATDGKELWLVAVRKSMAGQNEDKVYQVNRPKGLGNEQMQQAMDAVVNHLVTGDYPKMKVRDADMFDFGENQ
jgi:hypothetical protein